MTADAPKCLFCKRARVALVSVKCNDSCFWKFGDIEHEGYVPGDVGIGDEESNYMEFSYCIDCGRIQGTWPVSARVLEKIKRDEE